MALMRGPTSGSTTYSHTATPSLNFLETTLRYTVTQAQSQTLIPLTLISSLM